MEAGLLAGIFGLLGALIGSAASIATIIIQARVKDRRDRMQQVTSMAMEHFKFAVGNATNDGGVLPPAVFAAYYLGFLDLIEKGELNPETFQKLSDDNDALAQLALKQGVGKAV